MITQERSDFAMMRLRKLLFKLRLIGQAQLRNNTEQLKKELKKEERSTKNAINRWQKILRG